MDSQILTKDYIAKLLPKRPKDAHKGTFGKVLVIAGSQSYPGAAYLACAGAYRVGAGLVTLASSPTVCNFVIKKLPEVTLIPLHEYTADELFNSLGQYSEEDPILIGPGLTTSFLSSQLVNDIFEQWDLPPIIIDGDGLNILSKVDRWWEKLDEHFTHVVLTPHPKELSRLSQLSIEEIQRDRVKIARHFAVDVWGQTVVLKGANTVIASTHGEIYVSPFANPLLATAGTGDVLAGIIAGLIAQKLDEYEAACCGVYIHGLGAELLKEELGDSGALASDLIKVLPQAIKTLK